jgi:hypothetical protein
MKTKIKTWLKSQKTHAFYAFMLASAGVIYFIGYPNTLQVLSQIIYREPRVYHVVEKVEAAYEPEIGTEDWIRAEWLKAGADWNKVWAIIQCESRWNSDAYNVNTNGTVDSGLYQINSIHKAPLSCSINTVCSTEWAIKKWQRDGDFNAWACAKLLGL